MSVEAVPPPTYSFSGEPSPPSSPTPSEDLVSAQSHAFSDLEVCGNGQPPNDAQCEDNSTLPTSLPVPQRRPAPASPVSPEVRVSVYPDHKLQPVTLHQRLSYSKRDTPATGTPGSKLNPTNYVSVFRKTHRRAFSLSRVSIKGEFAVNPFLEIPPQLLSPLAPGEIRKNLLLKVENGGIDVDVHLIGEPPQDASNTVLRTELHLEICGDPDNTFPLLARVHTPTLRRPPFRLTLVSRNGFLSSHLPPSFHGLLKLHVGAGDLNNRIALSAALGTHATILSEDSTSRSYFVGALGAGRWEGDRAEIRVEYGKIRVQFSGAVERDFDGLRRVGWELIGY